MQHVLPLQLMLIIKELGFLRLDLHVGVDVSYELDPSELLDDPWDNETSNLAITGKAVTYLQQNDPLLLQRVLRRARVFSRMSPLQKTTLVEKLQEGGYTVGMVGDGANDTGALNAADVCSSSFTNEFADQKVQLIRL